MNGKKLSKNITKRKKLFVLLLPLFISNLTIYFLCQEPVVTPNYKDHVQVIIKGNLKTPFIEDKQVLLVDLKTKNFLDNCYLLDIQDDPSTQDSELKEITISIASNKLHQIDDKAIYSIFPNKLNILDKYKKKKRKQYEIIY